MGNKLKCTANFSTLKFFIKINLNLLMLIATPTVWCREYEECKGIRESVDSNVVVASKQNCAKYIFCGGENSYEGVCFKGNFFNENTGTCEDSKNVKCYNEPFNESKETEKPFTKSDENTEITEIMEIVKTAESAESVNTEILTTQMNFKTKCSSVQGFNSIKHVANSATCKAFYICYKKFAIAMLCEANMYFNENSGKCESQMPENCKSKYSVRLNCFKGVNDYVPHPYRCEYYFHCVNGYLMIMRCPHNFTWHYKRGTCVHKTISNCYFEESTGYLKDNSNRV